MQAGRQLAVVLSKAPGFISYLLLDTGDGTLATVSIFETRADLEEAERLIASWVAPNRTPLTVPSAAMSGEILVQKGM
jgi:hypothetical protein